MIERLKACMQITENIDHCLHEMRNMLRCLEELERFEIPEEEN